MSTEQSLLELLGKAVAYGGGGAVVAYGLFRFLGQKWIENKFAERLDHLKHEHTKEIEHLRLEINTLLSRVGKLHEREFTVVPEAWGRLQDSLWRLKKFVSVFQSFPDVAKMGTDRFDEYLSGTTFLESEKKTIREATDKNKALQETIFWYDLAEVRTAYGNFHEYLEKNCVFMTPDLRSGFSAIDDKMWDALQKRELGKQMDDFPMWVEASRKMREQIEPDLKVLETAIQKKLHGDAKG